MLLKRDINDGSIKIVMKEYIKEILTEYEEDNLKGCVTPSQGNLFVLDKNSQVTLCTVGI